MIKLNRNYGFKNEKSEPIWINPANISVIANAENDLAKVIIVDYGLIYVDETVGQILEMIKND